MTVVGRATSATSIDAAIAFWHCKGIFTLGPKYLSPGQIMGLFMGLIITGHHKPKTGNNVASAPIALLGM